MKVLVIGGNRFFGKKLVAKLLSANHEVTLLNRQNLNDGFANQVQRIQCDRQNHQALRQSLYNKKFDLVYDQVCYEPGDARAACEIFRDKTPKYVFTSSQSVYQNGPNLRESDFDPTSYSVATDVDSKTDYAEAKRQCEAAFFMQRSFLVTAVRFTFVVGNDDYTGRLKWHVDRVKERQPIYFPNLNARFPLIHSSDAAEVLFALSTKNISGALNASADEPTFPEKLIATIQNVTNSEALLIKFPVHGSESPYGVANDWFMSTERLRTLIGGVRPIDAWLKEVVESL